MDISIGIITYNDYSTLGSLLQSIQDQILNNVHIREVIIVSVLSNEKFINKTICEFNLRFRVLIEKSRKGKYSAVNLFLENAESDILVLCSGDITLHEKCLENLCKPLLNRKNGITSSRPKPFVDIKNPTGFAVNLVWNLHHEMSLAKPKFGELIAFRNLHFQIPKTSVDEEMIAREIISQKYNSCYVPESVVYNKGPKTVIDYLNQRRRIYCGHLVLKKRYHYNVLTLNNFHIFKFLISKKIVRMKDILLISYSIVLEGVSRLMGYLDYYRGKEQIKWTPPS